MSINYTSKLEQINWREISDIFESVGWGKRNPSEIKISFEKSGFARFAFLKDKIAGFGRTVDDGTYYAMIVDLVVHPDFQGMGIGTAILQELEQDLSGFQFTTLTAAPGKSDFYLKRGWYKQNSAFIWPRSEEQRHNFSEN